MEQLKSTLLLTDKRVLKTAIGAVTISKAIEHIGRNRDHYVDMLKLDFKSYNVAKNYGLHYWDLDPSIGYRLCEIYEELNTSYEKIFNMLNMENNFSISHTPLEVKYVFEYVRKYKTNYKKSNTISKDEILKPLTDKEKKIVSKIF